MPIITNQVCLSKIKWLNNTGKGLCALCLSCVVPFAFANESAAEKADEAEIINDGHKYHHLDAVSITASGRTLQEVVQASKVLSESDLKQASGTSLGELLENMPGVSNGSFGPGVGRPVIRGMSGNRVKIAVNGNDTADVSAMSNDHAPMADAANAKQVEVIYGPSTLLYGSGAIGGVVNMSDERLHDAPLVDAEGNGLTQLKARSQVSSVDQGTQLSAQLDSGFADNWVVHLDGFVRESKDFDAPDSNLNGTVLNTATASQGFNAGLSYITNSSRSGLAISFLDYEYGVPNEENEDADITPTQMRLDGVFDKDFFAGPLESVKTQFSFNDYSHEELDGDNVVGYFEKQNFEIKSIFTLSNASSYDSKLGVHVNKQDLSLCHDHGGCEEGVPNYSDLPWDGSKGSSFDPLLDANGNTIEFAHDTPMPETETLDVALFGLLSQDWLYGKQEYALRLDQRSIKADPVSIRPASRQAASYYEEESFLAITASAGWTWLSNFENGASQKWGLSLAHTERAPQADEMYWNGDHHATFSYQLDNPDLDKETAHTFDLTWQYLLGAYQLDAAAYYYDFDGYIFNELQSVKDPYHGNDVYQFVQEDAYLTGFELAAQYELNERWAVNVVADHAVGRLEVGGNLPRIPPMTLLAGIAWQQGHWLINANVKHYSEQDQRSENETATSAYSSFNAMAAYEFEWQGMHVDVRLKGNNLTDELGRNHVSYLKAFSPVPGRNLTLDLTLAY